MAFFGKSKEEKIPSVEVEIRTNNSWFTRGIPKAIVRNVPTVEHGTTVEYFNAKGCDYLLPYIKMENCLKIVETDETFEILTKSESYKVIPKRQVLELQY